MNGHHDFFHVELSCVLQSYVIAFIDHRSISKSLFA